MATASGSQIKMNVPAVRNMAKNFGNIGQVLTNVSKVLEALSTVLKTTAFIGLVGGAVVAQYIDQVRPQIKQMGDKCIELQKDLNTAVVNFENKDALGASRFHQ
jgi:uncharacterized protein YukE